MGTGLWGKQEGMWALEVGSVEQASGPAWPDCILGRNDIWEGCLVYGFQCLQGAYEDTLSGKILQIL